MRTRRKVKIETAKGKEKLFVLGLFGFSKSVVLNLSYSNELQIPKKIHNEGVGDTKQVTSTHVHVLNDLEF